MFYIVANWKANLLQQQVEGFLQKLSLFFQSNNIDPAKKIVICPAFTMLSRNFESDYWQIGAQDCSPFSFGAHTGDICSEMLSELNCKYVILGHSERRNAPYNESSALIKDKAKAAIKSGIKPIICIGENLQEKNNNNTNSCLEKQIIESLPTNCNEMIIAYEPVWAIGSGMVPQISEIEKINFFIKNVILSKFPLTKDIKILYGGSVSEGNCTEISSINNVDGVLVGGASLDYKKFANIISNCIVK